MEDGHYIENEDAFEPHITRDSQVLVLFDTKKTEVDDFANGIDIKRLLKRRQ